MYDELVAALPDSVAVLDRAPAEDKDAVVVTKETAEEYSLTAIGDLADVAGDLVLGGPPEWKTRSDRPPRARGGLRRGVQGLPRARRRRPADAEGPAERPDRRGQHLQHRPDLASGELVALEDPESLFAAQNIVPLVRNDALTDDIEAALNAVSAALSQEALLGLVDAVVAQTLDPADVAKDWVTANIQH